MKNLIHLFVTVFMSTFASLLVSPTIADVTMEAICPGKYECSLALYLTGFQQAVSIRIRISFFFFVFSNPSFSGCYMNTHSLIACLILVFLLIDMCCMGGSLGTSIVNLCGTHHKCKRRRCKQIESSPSIVILELDRLFILELELDS
ncbi:hypothetical protein F511_06478 [Dorcoceras hygrometricum]|uniref:Uncharacterized protein n=1 Tax=Dorcoceras hygrometricum TaxID=472368 RepID=A0A2Z7D8C3_9LAMI|nr:hypothetical protein F511_06478 [Dorcoceras hygrometricum]